MAGRVALDTSFLIDLQRERLRREDDGAAHSFLRAVRELHTVLDVDEGTALLYGRITREMRAKGTLIGTNHLWIAATCVYHDTPLVTANVAHFRRVPELEVIGYH